MSVYWRLEVYIRKGIFVFEKDKQVYAKLEYERGDLASFIHEERNRRIEEAKAKARLPQPVQVRNGFWKPDCSFFHSTCKVYVEVPIKNDGGSGNIGITADIGYTDTEGNWVSVGKKHTKKFFGAGHEEVIVLGHINLSLCPQKQQLERRFTLTAL